MYPPVCWLLLSVWGCTGLRWRHGRRALACKRVVSHDKVRKVEGCSRKRVTGERICKPVLFGCGLRFFWCFLFVLFGGFFRGPFRQASLAQHHHLLGSSCSKYSCWPCPLLGGGDVSEIALSYLPQQCAWSRLLVVRKCRSCSRKTSLPTFGKSSGPCELVRRNTCAFHWWLHPSVKYILLM